MFSTVLYQLTFSPLVQESSLFSTPSPAFIVCRFFDDGYSDYVICISLIVSDLFMCLLVICLSSLENRLFSSFPHFLIEFFIYILNCMSCLYEWVKLLSCVRLFATPWDVAYQAPPSMAFSKQEYWSGLPFPSPGDLPNPGLESRSPALAGRFFPTELGGKHTWGVCFFFFIKLHELFVYFRG